MKVQARSRRIVNPDGQVNRIQAGIVRGSDQVLCEGDGERRTSEAGDSHLAGEELDWRLGRANRVAHNTLHLHADNRCQRTAGERDREGIILLPTTADDADRLLVDRLDILIIVGVRHFSIRLLYANE